MPKTTAGILLYRRAADRPRTEVLLVLPASAGPVARATRSWSIPKGKPRAGEGLIAAARREFEEETGCRAPGDGLVELAQIADASGNRVTAWAADAADPDLDRHCRERRAPVPPPGSEIAAVAWFSLDEARVRLRSGQTALLDELGRLLRLRDSRVPATAEGPKPDEAEAAAGATRR